MSAGADLCMSAINRMLALVQLRYNFRLDLMPGQVRDLARDLARAFGCARVVFNDGLRARKDARPAGLAYPKTGDLSKALITETKRTPGRAWLAEVSAVVLRQALHDLDGAYKNLFESRSGKLKGPKVAQPRLRSHEDNRQAIRFTANARWRVARGGTLSLPKIAGVEVRWSRALPSPPSSVTVAKEAVRRSCGRPSEPAQELRSRSAAHARTALPHPRACEDYRDPTTTRDCRTPA